MRRLPITPHEPPYDDEAGSSSAGAPTGSSTRPPRPRVRPAGRTTADRPGRPVTAPGGGGRRRGGPSGPGGPPRGRGGADGQTEPGGTTVDRTPRHLAMPERTVTGTGMGSAASHAVPGLDPVAGPRPGHPAGSRTNPPPRETAVVIVRAIVETLGGVRPASHLAGWTTPRLQNDLERIVAQTTDRRRGQVRSVRVSEPRPGVAEVSAVISRGARVAALALRMESSSGRWRVTTLQVG
ncbi:MULTISPECIES: Rv3235 family protein [Frankia]|nr:MULTISPECIES: Rv3235 family protein [Frankia]